MVDPAGGCCIHRTLVDVFAAELPHDPKPTSPVHAQVDERVFAGTSKTKRKRRAVRSVRTDRAANTQRRKGDQTPAYRESLQFQASFHPASLPPEHPANSYLFLT